MPLTNDNYENVSANVKGSRELYDKVEINIRALNSAGVSAEHFGALLIPIIMDKLPNIVMLQISRKLGLHNWSITDFMDCINEEISTRKNFEFLKNNDFPDDNQEKEITTHTTSPLAVMWIGCVFCGSKNRYDRCDIVQILVHGKKSYGN